MKTLTSIFMTLIMIALSSTMTFAQVKTETTDQNKVTPAQVIKGGNFIDDNKNGICDNFETRVNKSPGKNFIDKNGDGICDHRGNVGKETGKVNRKGCGQGYQHRHGFRQGNGNGNCCGRGYNYKK